jgi:hypothetical protein
VEELRPALCEHAREGIVGKCHSSRLDPETGGYSGSVPQWMRSTRDAGMMKTNSEDVSVSSAPKLLDKTSTVLLPKALPTQNRIKRIYWKEYMQQQKKKREVYSWRGGKLMAWRVKHIWSV